MFPVNYPTIARQKLERAVVAAGSVAALAVRVGVQASTLRLLVAGASEPRAPTIRKLQRLGIKASDWFQPAKA